MIKFIMQQEDNHNTTCHPSRPLRYGHNQDEVSLSVDLISALNKPPYFATLSQYSADLKIVVSLCDQICKQTPHPLSPSCAMNITEVSVQPQRTAITDIYGTVHSRTHLPLPPHTDSTFAEIPHELVIFQMVSPDLYGGETIVISVGDVIAKLNSKEVDRLKTPTFPFGRNRYPVICGSVGEETVRYYRAQIELAARGSPLEYSDVMLLDSLDRALNEASIQARFKLHAGDILFLNNTRVLHGRTGFSNNSARIINRIRAYCGALRPAL